MLSLRQVVKQQQTGKENCWQMTIMCSFPIPISIPKSSRTHIQSYSLLIFQLMDIINKRLFEEASVACSLSKHVQDKRWITDGSTECSTARRPCFISWAKQTGVLRPNITISGAGFRCSCYIVQKSTRVTGRLMDDTEDLQHKQNHMRQHLNISVYFFLKASSTNSVAVTVICCTKEITSRVANYIPIQK